MRSNKLPCDYDDTQSLFSFARDILNQITPERLSDAANRHGPVADLLRAALVMARNRALESGISSEDFGLLLILNGLAAMGNDEQNKRIQENQ